VIRTEISPDGAFLYFFFLKGSNTNCPQRSKGELLRDALTVTSASIRCSKLMPSPLPKANYESFIWSASDAPSDAPTNPKRLPPRDKMHLTHKPIKLLAQKLLSSVCTIPTRIAESFMHLISLQYSLKKRHEVALRIEATCGERIQERINFFFEIVIINSYSFRKRSFNTIYWLTSDPGSGVQGIGLKIKRHLGRPDPASVWFEATGRSVTIKAAWVTPVDFLSDLISFLVTLFGIHNTKLNSCQKTSNISIRQRINILNS